MAWCLLIGNLGAGKTTLAKGIVEGRNGTPADQVSSPTFTLIHQYGDKNPVYHIDLYRLDEQREVESLGLDEIFGSGALILLEWGERFPALLPRQRTEIRLRTLPDDSARNRRDPSELASGNARKDTRTSRTRPDGCDA